MSDKQARLPPFPLFLILWIVSPLCPLSFVPALPVDKVSCLHARSQAFLPQTVFGPTFTSAARTDRMIELSGPFTDLLLPGRQAGRP
jgi:hypothetical protein